MSKYATSLISLIILLFNFCSRCNGENHNCCTKWNPCQEYEGDCDSDDQCIGDLRCGENNCPLHGRDWDDDDDCCEVRV